MHETFLEAHSGAAVLVIGALIAGALAEWLVTFRERLQTEGGPRARLAVRTLVEATTTRTAGRHESDRGTKRILVLGMVAGFAAAWLAARYVPGADLPGSDWVWVILGVLIMLAGFTLRVGSIVVLGRFFRRDVTVEAAQTVIRRGPYRYIRHPAYAGNLLVALGFGLALANWLSIAALVALPFLGLLPRIRVEEAALESALGEPYRAYEADTARLVPGLW
jgi:protein-S-isoprenylcysteine O-methyltransferase Ste14